jgi:hypothetical protein
MTETAGDITLDFATGLRRNVWAEIGTTKSEHERHAT